MKNHSSEYFNIENQTKGRRPSLPFLSIKEAALGKKYDLSLVFADSKQSKKLNKLYRDKDKPANILSFPLSEDEGEIFIDLEEARRQAPEFDRKYTNFVAFLFIHGLFHLKGFEHGGKMEESEKRIRKKFTI